MMLLKHETLNHGSYVLYESWIGRNYFLIDLRLSIYIDQCRLPMRFAAVCCPLWGAANHLLMQSVVSRLLVR